MIILSDCKRLFEQFFFILHADYLIRSQMIIRSVYLFHVCKLSYQIANDYPILADYLYLVCKLSYQIANADYLIN